MRRRLIVLMGAVFLLGPMVHAAIAQIHQYRPQVGRPHVDFTLPTVRDRKPVSLSDFRGKKVLLIQFASW